MMWLCDHCPGIHQQVQRSPAVPASDAPVKLPWPGPTEAAAPGMSRALARVLHAAESKENDLEADDRPPVTPVESRAGKNQGFGSELRYSNIIEKTRKHI